MKSAPLTVVPGIRASSRTDAELVTCQVHDSDTLSARGATRAAPPDASVSGLRSDRHPRSHASCRSRLSQALPRQKSPGAGAHLPGRSGGEHDGFDACDVGG